jgi:hypothetical protein
MLFHSVKRLIFSVSGMLRTFAKFKVLLFSAIVLSFGGKHSKVEISESASSSAKDPQSPTWVDDGGRKRKKVQGGGWNEIFFNTQSQARSS